MPWIWGRMIFLTKPVDKTEGLLARMRNMLALRHSQKQLADRAAWLAEEVRKATADIVMRERGAIFLLSRVAEYRDPETGTHIMRMANYSRLPNIHVCQLFTFDWAPTRVV